MAVDPVPYVVHGAKHSADVFRQALSDSTGGAEGISHPTDLNVRQTGTPSSQVRVAPGGVLIPNTYSGGGGQSYTGRNASETLVNIPASDSTGAKSWKIIFRVQDPQFGGPAPSNPEEGPYSFIECVAKSATVSDPHYVLADVDVPASTATITNAMITDRRSLGQPKRDGVIFARPRLAADDDPKENYLSAFWDHGSGGKWFGELFPGGWGSPNMADIPVPEWATHMSVRADWLSVRCESGKNSWGRYWIEYGDLWKGDGWGDGRNLEYVSQQFNFNTQVGDTYNTNWALMDQLPVPAKLRGKTIRFAFKAGRAATADNNGVFMNSLSGLGLDITFAQKPIGTDTL